MRHNQIGLLLDPSASIAIIETDLRHLVEVVLSVELGPEWIKTAFDPGTVEELTRRFDEERKRRAPARVPSQLLAYTHLYELRKLIERRWQAFAPALGEKKEFVVFMDTVEDFRNAPAHSRELLPHERRLLEGLAGLIRTRVTQFLSAQSPDRKHYPVIEAVRDSFGNSASDLSSTWAIGAGGTTVRTGLRLQVGDIVEFEARAWDPQGRELQWCWGVTFAKSGKVMTGSEVCFSWAPTEAHVGISCVLEIEMLSSGQYHRHLGYDQRVSFQYEVDPPSLT